jgi:HAD superfamily hydrolase (TIGR01509 family)
MRYQYIFWDNDGVLVDTEKLYYQANRETLAMLGINLTDELFTDISLNQGLSVLDLARQGHITQAEFDRLRSLRNDRYSELLMTHDLVLPGVREVLLSLHRKIGMAIVTSSLGAHFEIIHKRSNLLQFFDFILTREDYGKSKPDPEPYLLALGNSRQVAKDCLVIEDSPRGLAAAKAAGLDCWVIPSDETSGQDFSRADCVLGSIEEVAERLL